MNPAWNNSPRIIEASRRIIKIIARIRPHSRSNHLHEIRLEGRVSMSMRRIKVFTEQKLTRLTVPRLHVPGTLDSTTTGGEDGNVQVCV